MKSIFHLIAASLLLLAATFFTGCRTADRAQTGQLASLEISGHSEIEILRTMKAVFLDDGYEHIKDLTFDKKGSAWDTAAYGGWTSAVWIRMKASVDPAPISGDYIIGCDAYTVNAHNQGEMEDERKNSYSKRSECEKILAEIKTRLDAHVSATDQP
jgi:hypothetical protein